MLPRNATADEVTDSIMLRTEVAAMLRTPVETLEYWGKVGKGPPYWRSGTRVYYDRRQVIDWLNDQQRLTSRGNR